MSQSNSRHRRRAIKAVSKKAAGRLAKDRGIDVSQEVSIDPLVQGTKIAAIERAIQQLVEVNSVNHQQILKAFNLTDAHLWVLRQIAKDSAAGQLLMKQGPTPALDMDAYYDLFNAFQHEEAKKAQAQKKKKAAEAEKTVEQEVFGGDVSNEDSEGDEESESGQGDGEELSDSGDEADPLPEVPDNGGAVPGSEQQAEL
jgi:hypothetical protein